MRRNNKRLSVSLVLLAAIGLPAPANFNSTTASTSLQSTREVEVRLLRAPRANGNEQLPDEVSLAIMGTSEFDATSVDASSIIFAGAGVSVDADGNRKVSFEDVNHDEFIDLVIKLGRNSLRLGSRPIKAAFIARTNKGEFLSGIECVQASGLSCSGDPIDGRDLQQHEATAPIGPNAVTFSEDFDGEVAPDLPAGWTAFFVDHAITLNCTSGPCEMDINWATTTTNPSSPPNAAFHNDPDCVTDNYLISPAISIFSATSQLSFSNAYNLENNFDGSVLEISINAGAFQDILAAGGSFVSGGYNGTIIIFFDNPIAGRPAWTGLSGGSASTPAYVTTVVNLPAAAAGQSVVFRWRCATDCSGSAGGSNGQWIDNVSISQTPPCTITCPANQIKSNDPNECGAVVNFPSPTTSGDCGTVTCSPVAGSFFPVGATLVACNAAAGPGCTFTVTVNDTQAPNITCPANIAQPAAAGQCSAVVTYSNATATDNCPGVGAPACNPPSGSTFPKGMNTVNCNVSDASSNVASCSFTVTVNDTTPPAITCPPNQSVTSGVPTAVNYPPQTASDNCPGVTSSCNPPSGSIFALGTTTVTCTAIDSSSNFASCFFSVAVVDSVSPTIICPANVTVGTQSGQTSAVVSYPPPSATDNAPGVTVFCSPASGSSFPLGVTTVTCTATDVAGNKSSCSFTASVGNSQATVIIPGSKGLVEFGNQSPLSPARKPPKARKNPCGVFTVENTGFAPLMLTLDSITRTGIDVDSRKIADANDTRFFDLSLLASDGSTTSIDFGGVVTIQPGGSQSFCLRFSPLIPALAGKATGVAAANALPDTVTSRVTFRQNAGSPVSVNVLSHLATAVIFINPANPRQLPSIGFTRSGNDLTVSYGLYDSNLDVTRAKYEFLNGGGQVVGSAFEIGLTEQLRALGLVRGQSFAVEQRFTGASDHPEIVGVRVSVSDGETSVTNSATVAAKTTASLSSFNRTSDGELYVPVMKLTAWLR